MGPRNQGMSTIRWYPLLRTTWKLLFSLILIWNSFIANFAFEVCTLINYLCDTSIAIHTHTHGQLCTSTKTYPQYPTQKQYRHYTTLLLWRHIFSPGSPLQGHHKNPLETTTQHCPLRWHANFFYLLNYNPKHSSTAQHKYRNLCTNFTHRLPPGRNGIFMTKECWSLNGIPRPQEVHGLAPFIAIWVHLY